MTGLKKCISVLLIVPKVLHLASGTTLDTVRVITAIHQKHSNKGMAETIRRNIELVGLPEWTEDEQTFRKITSENSWCKRRQVIL